MSPACVICGKEPAGPVPRDSIAAIAGPQVRPTIGGGEEPICFKDWMWSAVEAGIIERDKRERP